MSTSHVKDNSVNKFKENIESFFERFIKGFKDSSVFFNGKISKKRRQLGY
jgi:hypothetical protein